jgi:hypothetical protein
MKPLNRRLFILLLSVGSCVTTTGCFSCTEVRETCKPRDGRVSLNIVAATYARADLVYAVRQGRSGILPAVPEI